MMRIGKQHILRRVISVLRVAAVHLESEHDDPLAAVQLDLMAVELDEFQCRLARSGSLTK